MTIFDEIANLDRPFVPVKLNIGGKPYEFQAKRPNSLEADAIDAYYTEEYSKLIVKKTEPQNGSESELDQMRRILHTRTREEITMQLLQTRIPDIQRLTAEKVNFNPQRELASLMDLSEEEKDSYIENRRAELEEAEKISRVEIKAEYDIREIDELIELLSQININVKALAEAQAGRNAIYVYFALHDANGDRVCPSPESVREQFQLGTISNFVKEIEGAFQRQVRADLPFVSQADSAPNGQPSSANTSEPETTQSSPGGKPTKATRKNSKRSTTPRDGTLSKKA